MEVLSALPQQLKHSGCSKYPLDMATPLFWIILIYTFSNFPGLAHYKKQIVQTTVVPPWNKPFYRAKVLISHLTNNWG